MNGEHLMPKKLMVDYLSEYQEEVVEKWTKEMRTQLDERSLSISMDSIYIETGKEFVALVLSNLTQIEMQYKLKLQDFSDKVVQLGWPLTVVLAGLRTLARILFEGMKEKGAVNDQNNMDVVYSFEQWMTPMQDEIVNTYASSWERTVSIQKIALQELSAPLIPVFDKVSVMPLVGTIDTERAKQIMENLLNGIVQHRAEVVLIDITGVPVVDTMVAHHIIQAAEAVRLVGAKCMIVGIRPEIAQTIVSLGIDLTQILTTSTLQKGIQKALANTNRKIVELEGEE
jgi:rsbT co-antagonist protein RsbR